MIKPTAGSRTIIKSLHIPDHTYNGKNGNWQFLLSHSVNLDFLSAIGGSKMIFHSLTFARSRGTLRMLMNDKIMFDLFHFINSTKYCETKETICALYFITSSHFPTRVRYA